MRAQSSVAARLVNASESSSGATAATASDAAFCQAMVDTATVVKLDARILLKLVVAAAGDAACVEQAQVHLTRNAAKLIRLLVAKLDSERTTSRRAALLGELFLDACRLLKARTVQVVRDTEAAARDGEYVGVLKQSTGKLAELVDAIVANVAHYRQRLRQRSENVKAGVLRQTKRLVQALKELQAAARSSRVAVDVSARQVTEHLLFFLEIAEAAVMDDEAQLLRSAVSDALQCARDAQRRRGSGGGSASSTAADDATADELLTRALDTAVSAIRQVVYGVLAGVDSNDRAGAYGGGGGGGDDDDDDDADDDDLSHHDTPRRAGSTLASSAVQARRVLFGRSATRTGGMSVLTDDADDLPAKRASDFTVDARHAAATARGHSGGGAPVNDDDVAALKKTDLLPVEVELAQRRPMTSFTLKYRREETSGKDVQLAVMLEKNNTAIGFYNKHFLNGGGAAAPAASVRPHLNFIAVIKDKKHGPYAVVSVRRSPELTAEASEREQQYLAILRTKGADELIFVASAGAKDKDLIKAVRDAVPYLAKADVSVVPQADFVGELAAFEEKNLLRSYKFGVLLLTADNKTADESGLYGWRGAHAGAEQFLGLLGQRVRLKGWPHYKGGLDARTDTTGTHSWYTKHCGAEIMFHVAHEIPYTEGDAQQVERKRHIGNDIVVIVYREPDAPPFNPETIKSHFNHIFLVVTPVRAVSGAPHYRIEMLTNESLRPYGPKFKHPPIYRHSAAFGNMLLAKLINGERAAYASPTFAQKFKRTRRELLELMCEKRLSSKS
jgi:RAP1 GTPase activating protein 1